MNKEQEGTPIDLTERVDVVYTDKAPAYVRGTKDKIHPKAAEKLKKKGWIK